MEKPDAGLDNFMFFGTIVFVVLIICWEITGEWRKCRGRRSIWHISGPLKRPFNPKPLDDWAKKQRK